MENIDFLDEKIKFICESHSTYYFPWGIGKNIDGSKFWTKILDNTYIIHLDFYGNTIEYEELKNKIVASLKEQGFILEKTELINDTFYGCEEKLYFIEQDNEDAANNKKPSGIAQMPEDEPLLPTTKQKAKSIWKLIVTAIGLIAGIIAIIVFFTGKNFPDFGKNNTNSTSNSTSQSNSIEHKSRQAIDYFISVATSDTVSTDLEPAKKIVVTASADTENIVLASQAGEETYGPFNMTMETERRFSFIAVFEEPGTHYITITAYSSNGTTATEEISIDI